MANRRMFSLKIVGSDAFLDMPATSRELYFQLGMYADDDGFVSPKKIVRMVGSSDDDLKMLMAKKFVLPFQNGVVVIKHWRMNNEIKKDRYIPTQYTDQKELLFIKENSAYTFNESKGKKLKENVCIQNVSKMETQIRLGKDSIDKIIYYRQLKNGENFTLLDGLRVKKAYGKIVAAETGADVSERDYPEIKHLI